MSILAVLVYTERENLELKAKLARTEELRRRALVGNILLEDKLKKMQLRMATEAPRDRACPPLHGSRAETASRDGSMGSSSGLQVAGGLESLVPERRARNGSKTANRSQGRRRYESRIPAEVSLGHFVSYRADIFQHPKPV
jgi:hypothetical protein